MFRNPKIKNRSDFKSYCLRAIGQPVVMINVSDDQVEDRIDDALDKFWEFHLDGSLITLLKIQITQDMLDTNRIPLPDGIIGVKQVLNPGFAGTLATSNLQYRQFITEVLDIRSMTGGGLSHYVQSMSYLNTLNQMIGSGIAEPIEFNTHRGFVELLAGFDQQQVDDWIILECYVIQDPDEYVSTWNNPWLKNYATALIQYQWGLNLAKFNNAPLPGGVTVNGQEILAEAKERKQQLEEELVDKWQDPPMFFMG